MDTKLWGEEIRGRASVGIIHLINQLEEFYYLSLAIGGSFWCFLPLSLSLHHYWYQSLGKDPKALGKSLRKAWGKLFASKVNWIL